MSAQAAEMIWNNDGHTLWLKIEKTELQIIEVKCPEAEDSTCASSSGCVVKWFVNLYGFDCNIGACPPEEHLEVCWALVGDQNNLDMAQLWFVPVKDEIFYAWMQSRVQL